MARELIDGAAVILAAGKGTRMRSEKPKTLRTLLGEPMLAYVLAAVSSVFKNPPLIVAGHGAKQLEAAFPDAGFVIQKEQKGTGHALATALAGLDNDPGFLLVVNGDAPLIEAGVVQSFIERSLGADLSFATLDLPDPGAYGRVIRENGRPVAIIEAKDYEPLGHGEWNGEVNAGLYLVKTAVARKLAPRLDSKNKSGECYLTDLVALAAREGDEVRAVECGQSDALLGVNTPAELARAEEILRSRTVERMLASGVLIHAPGQARISPFSEIEPGAEISGPCLIHGKTRIAAEAVVDGFCVIKDSEIGSGAHVHSFCHLDGVIVEACAQAGPYARLRTGARLGKEARVGNFVELKNATLGDGAKAGHLSYLGDAEIGASVNIGAGTITCNYDGREKHRTVIGERAFIGSNTALVAPVSVGPGALVGAGSTITKNVPEDSLGIARARQQNLPRRK